MVSKKPFLQKRKKNKKIGLKPTFRMVQEAVSTKMKRKKIKTHLSDGIQEAVPTKKKKKEENRLKTYLSYGPRSRFYKKEEKKDQNSPFGWYPRSRS